jgi:Cysteine-rich CPCC
MEDMEDSAASRWPCPCCGFLVFTEPAGSYEICPVCGWEDDLSQLRFPGQDGGANGISLLGAQQEFEKRELRGDYDCDRPPAELGLVRERGWRPLDPDTDRIETPEPGRDYGRRYASDSSTYYYWRHDDPRDWRLDVSDRCIQLYRELSERPRPLDGQEAAMMVDLVDAWRALEQRKHIALMNWRPSPEWTPPHGPVNPDAR